MSQSDSTSGADQWFQTQSVRFVWVRGTLEVYALKRDKPAGLLMRVEAGAAEAFREWLGNVDVSQ
jgi:hypothetical protein